MLSVDKKQNDWILNWMVHVNDLDLQALHQSN
jgi:hypothetical protein